MKRSMQVGGAILGGAALLAAGVLVGSKVGDDTIVVAAAGAESDGGLSQSDTFMTQAFLAASREFDALLTKVRKGDTTVGPAMTKQAVAVLAVKRSAQNEQLRAAADSASQAMLLIGAGVTANDGAAVQDGVAAYKDAQAKVVELSKVFTGETPGTSSPSPTPDAGSPAPAPSPS